MCSSQDDIQTQDQKDELTGGLAVSTKGGAEFTPVSIKNILNMLKFLINGGQDGGGRRRRDVSTTTVQVQTPEQVGDYRKIDILMERSK